MPLLTQNEEKILKHSYFLNFLLGPSFMLKIWVVGGGGLQDFSVSPSPLLGLIRVGTGLDWVGIGSGGIGD